MKAIDQILKIKTGVSYILQQMRGGVDYIHFFKLMNFNKQEHLVVDYGLDWRNLQRYVASNK